MKELQNAINEKFESIIADGVIEKVISEKMEACIDRVFESAFKNYGVFTKNLESQLEAAVEGGLFKLDLETYTDVINSLVKQKVAKQFEGLAQEQIIKSLDKMFNPVPEETTLQDLVTMVAEAYREEDYHGDRDDHLSMACEESIHGWFTLKFWKQKESLYSSHTPSPDIELHIGSNGKIAWLKEGSTDYGSHNYGVEALFYRMTIKRTKITDVRECDQGEFENTYIGLGEDC